MFRFRDNSETILWQDYHVTLNVVRTLSFMWMPVKFILIHVTEPDPQECALNVGRGCLVTFKRPHSKYTIWNLLPICIVWHTCSSAGEQMKGMLRCLSFRFSMLDRSAYRYCKRAGFSNKDVSWNFRDWTRKLRQWLWNELTNVQKGCLGQDSPL